MLLILKILAHQKSTRGNTTRHISFWEENKTSICIIVVIPKSQKITGIPPEPDYSSVATYQPQSINERISQNSELGTRNRNSSTGGTGGRDTKDKMIQGGQERNNINNTKEQVEKKVKEKKLKGTTKTERKKTHKEHRG